MMLTAPSLSGKGCRVEIKLQRALHPQVMYEETDCAICARNFYAQSVLAQITSYPDLERNKLCPSCISVMGSLNPERFPTFEEYEAALKRYSEPVFGNVEEAHRLSVADQEAFQEIYQASWLPRSEELLTDTLSRGDPRGELFGRLIFHLDCMARIDEEEYGGHAAQYIRQTLIPFCEREGRTEAIAWQKRW